MDPSLAAVPGISKVLAYDNIAILVLTCIAIFEGALIVWLLKGIFSLKDAMKALEVTLRILNARISKHDEEDL